VEYIVVMEAPYGALAEERILAIIPSAAIVKTTSLMLDRYAVQIRVLYVDESLRAALEGALNSSMGDSYLVWWNRVEV
jgi:hypothetical protein